MTGSVRYNRCLNFGLRLVCHHSSVAQQSLLYTLSNKCPSASPCSGAMHDIVSVRGRQWSELLKRMTAGVAFTTCDASTTLQVGECGEVKFVCSLQADMCRLPHTHYAFCQPSPPIWRWTERSALAACMSLLTGHLPGLCLGDYKGIWSVTS